MSKPTPAVGGIDRGPAELVNPVAWQAPAAEEIPGPSASKPPATDKEVVAPKGDVNDEPSLDVDWLVAEVLARNPDVRSAVAAWRAAATRYPQEVALDDPMFGYMLGPGSWGDPTVSSAYTLEASQKLPWPGKRRLRGDIARAEANAKFFDAGEERLRIAVTTRLAYYDYFMADRQLAVLGESQKLLQEFRNSAEARYKAAEVEQQDILLADVELAQVSRQRLELERQLRVAEARINTLLLLPADAPLARPPADLVVVVDSPVSVEELRTLALSQRPELAAQQARIRAERYAIELACKEYYPDVEVVGRYDAFWQETPLRPMVGMNLNLPLYKQKRHAAVSEARARVAKEQAALDSAVNEIAFAAEEARQQVVESSAAITVFREKLLPAAKQSVASARASYIAGRLDFLRLVEAQRQQLELQEEYYATLAAYHQRRAELDRVIGTPPGVLVSTEERSF
jgi:outer membrane protein TolC